MILRVSPTNSIPCVASSWKSLTGANVDSKQMKRLQKTRVCFAPGLTKDQFDNIKTYTMRTVSKGAYAVQHVKSLCSSAVITMEGLKKSSLYKTVSSPTFMEKSRLQKILDRDLESKYLIQMGAMIAANTASLGFGRFNLPFKTSKLNSAQNGIEDLETGLTMPCRRKTLYLVLLIALVWITWVMINTSILWSTKWMP